MGFLSRLPNSNELPMELENPWGSCDLLVDDAAILLNGAGKRCCICRRVILNRHLTGVNGSFYCPDCRPEGVKK